MYALMLPEDGEWSSARRFINEKDGDRMGDGVDV